MNWKQLLKKHLNITKNKSLSFMITNNNRNSKLIEIADSIKPFNHEDFLIALTLQGQEKMIGFTEKNKHFQLNFETPYEQFIFTFNKDSQWHRIIITRYNLINPLLGIKENIPSSEHQGYIFQILQSEKKELYESNLITPMDKKTGNVLYKNNPLHIQLKDTRKNTLSIKFNNKTFTITHNNTTFQFNTKNSTAKTSQSLLSFHFENVSHKGQYYYIKDKEYTGIVEHTIYNYQTFLIKRIIYNLIHAITPEPLYKEIQFFLIFNKKEGICIEIKKQTIEKNEKIVSQSNGKIFGTTIEIKLLETNKNNFPKVWKILYKNCVYYIEPINTIHTIPFWIVEKEYFVPIKITNHTNTTGTGWIRYKNFDNEKTIIEQKIKRLWQPLERPNIEHFCSSTFPIESVIPTLMFIFCIIFLLVSVVTLVIIIILSSSTPKTIDTSF